MHAHIDTNSWILCVCGRVGFTLFNFGSASRSSKTMYCMCVSLRVATVKASGRMRHIPKWLKFNGTFSTLLIYNMNVLSARSISIAECIRCSQRQYQGVTRYVCTDLLWWHLSCYFSTYLLLHAWGCVDLIINYSFVMCVCMYMRESLLGQANCSLSLGDCFFFFIPPRVQCYVRNVCAL